MVEVKKIIDTDLIFLYVLLLGIFSAAAYFLVQYLTPLGVFKSFTRKSKKSDGAAVERDDDEWVKGTPYDLHRKKKAASAAKKSS